MDDARRREITLTGKVMAQEVVLRTLLLTIAKTTGDANGWLLKQRTIILRQMADSEKVVSGDETVSIEEMELLMESGHSAMAKIFGPDI